MTTSIVAIAAVLPPKDYFRAKEVAVLVRSALRESFLGCRFSVRMGRGTASSWLDVWWQDGPTRGQVQEVADAFCGRDFDGGDDGYHERGIALLDGRPVNFGVDGVSCSRSLSREMIRRLVGEEFGREVAEAYIAGNLSALMDISRGNPVHKFLMAHSGCAQQASPTLARVDRGAVRRAWMPGDRV